MISLLIYKTETLISQIPRPYMGGISDQKAYRTSSEGIDFAYFKF